MVRRVLAHHSRHMPFFTYDRHTFPRSELVELDEHGREVSRVSCERDGRHRAPGAAHRRGTVGKLDNHRRRRVLDRIGLNYACMK